MILPRAILVEFPNIKVTSGENFFAVFEEKIALAPKSKMFFSDFELEDVSRLKHAKKLLLQVKTFIEKTAFWDTNETNIPLNATRERIVLVDVGDLFGRGPFLGTRTGALADDVEKGLEKIRPCFQDILYSK